MMKKLCTTIFFALIGLAAFSQTLDQAKLNSYFDELERSKRFFGSVELAENGKIRYAKAIGYADIEANKKAKVATKYRIGSISKTFTSVLVFMAIDDKKLALNTSLSRFFPNIKNANKITIGHMLNHRSGIHNFTDDPAYLNWNTQQKSEAEMVDIFTHAGSDFEPDSKAAYSNSNYVLLSYILQKVYKKPYATLLTKKIIKPLKLKNTNVGSQINPQNNECYSYKYLTAWAKQPETDPSVAMGAGAIVSTPGDLNKFAFALFNGKIVSPKSLETMKTIKDFFGYGLFQIPFYDKISYGHNGVIDGFSSVFGYFPNEKIGFALASNASNYDSNNIVIVLLSAIMGKPYQIPTFKAYEVAAQDLDQYLGVYSSETIPLKITITKGANGLVAQATGQSAFALDATEKDKFKFEQAGVVLEFNPADKSMLLKQGGGVFKFTKP